MAKISGLETFFYVPRRAAAVWFSIALVFTLVGIQQAHSQTFTVLHNFTGGTDGSTPEAGLTIDRAGNLYGTAASGGLGHGIVFKFSHRGSGWVMTPLHTFVGDSDGASPRARLSIGTDGSLYGTTHQGGSSTACGFAAAEPVGCGIVFNLRPAATISGSVTAPWTETVLHRFQGDDGANPSGDTTFDSGGNLYGTTEYGGGSSSNCLRGSCGIVYELEHSDGGWTEHIIYRFTGNFDGNHPRGGVVFDNLGNLYGTVVDAVPDTGGAVFELMPSMPEWIETTLYLFHFGFANLGEVPVAGLIIDSQGNLYGATSLNATVFEFTFAGGSWNALLLYTFTGAGSGPVANLAMDSAGNLYGTTLSQGANSRGSVFKLSPTGGGDWTYSTLHDFSGGSDGGYPYSNVVFDASGNLYGTASTGGTYGYGVVWQITP